MNRITDLKTQHLQQPFVQPDLTWIGDGVDGAGWIERPVADLQDTAQRVSGADRLDFGQLGQVVRQHHAAKTQGFRDPQATSAGLIGQ